ncbi:SRPBCC family protein [Streptomyces chartreusis]|uniref:SRPBCC family protein n=1 Tax=Streptomyces chartreusis TaxID=1969 RepID=UPI00380F784E
MLAPALAGEIAAHGRDTYDMRGGQSRRSRWEEFAMTHDGGLRLHLQRVLRAPRSVVFRALTEPQELAKWWGPEGFTVPSVESDLRPGGRYRIAMQPPEGDLFYLVGEFVEADPPERLSYTFRWEDPDPEDRETVVTLSLRDIGGTQAELVISQGDFATEARRALHEEGWTQSLDKLEELVSSA